MPFAEFLNSAPAGSGLGAFSEAGGKGGKPAERAAALPCQSSNNSTEAAGKLSAYQRKNAFSINENLNLAIERFGVEKVGFLTLTFPKNLTLKEANRRFNSLASHVLDQHFVTWVCVREFTKGGRPHFHLIVICRENIRDGFDFGNYLKMARINSRPHRSADERREATRLSRSLNPTPALNVIWKDLRRVLPLYQFGRAELVPIRKSAEALSRYVGGYIRKSMDFRPVEAKGARLITYAKNFPRKVVGHAWAFNTPASALWRKKVATFAELHRVKSLEGLSKRFGPRWAWWFRDVIESINLAPFLSGKMLSAYLSPESPDCLAFSEHLLLGGNFLALHLRRPELPEVDGKRLQPPARLRSAFEFHLANWDRTRDQLAYDASAKRREMAEMRASGNGMFYTVEAFAAAREKILGVPVISRAAERARNFTRLVHPEYFASNYA